MGKEARIGLLLGASACLLAVMVDWVIEDLNRAIASSFAACPVARSHSRPGRELEEQMTETATILTGPLGLGHEMMARGCGRLFERSGWRVRQLDSMSLLGPWSGGAGERLFKGLVAVPGLYDGLHFAHLRTGSRLANRIDRASNARLVPALRSELERHPADLLFSVFATGASAAGRLKAEMPGLRSVVLCTDVSVHRIWAAEGTDLFLVTSAAAEASVRRYLPRAPVAVVPPPVRPEFYAAPPQAAGQEGVRGVRRRASACW